MINLNFIQSSGSIEKYNSLVLYAEQVLYSMQLNPFETLFDPIPIIAVEQDALVVPKISEHYFNRQAVVVVLGGVVAVTSVVVV